jgi:molecular chaperone HscB
VTEALPDYFSLFHLEPRFELDATELTRRYRDIQGEIHPDRFVGKPAHEQRMAVQQAAYVNEAYQCLKQPLERAKYLLSLNHPAAASLKPALENDFLIEQMNLRETLETLSRNTASVTKLENFCGQIEGDKKQLQQDFVYQLNANNLALANTALAKWQFMEKLSQEAESLLDEPN